MSINSSSIVLPWLFLIGWMQAPKGAVSEPELANIPDAHGVALWAQYDLAHSLVELMLDQEGKGKAGQSLRRELRVQDAQLTKISGLATEASRAGERQLKADWRDDNTIVSVRFMEVVEETLLSGLPDVLTKPQMTRFEELYCQIEGLAVLRVPAYATRVGLSDDQRTRIKTLVAEYQEKSREHHRAIFSSRAGDDALRTNIGPLKSLAKDLDVKILQLLTASQRTAWRKLIGEKFEWDETLESLAYKPEP